jgi:hypothetical protein
MIKGSSVKAGRGSNTHIEKSIKFSDGIEHPDCGTRMANIQVQPANPCDRISRRQ